MTRSGNRTPSKDGSLLTWYGQMLLIRRVEERLSTASVGGDLPGPVHVSIGQEAVPVGVCATLRDGDWMTSTHRGHGHYLARGGDPKKLVAEVYGRSTGACRGRGGSMHVADVSKGMLGAQGIVGSGIGLATGAALSEQIRGAGAVAVSFFGDGAANQGVLLEALNIAAVWKLPLILVCENNGWSEYTPTSQLTSGVIADRARPFGVPSASVDGNDVQAVFEATNTAVSRARSGDGPTLIEARTYRTKGHVETEATFLPGPYRGDDEVGAWLERDPIRLVMDTLTRKGVRSETFAEISRSVDDVVEEAFRFALESPLPDPIEAESWAYATATV